MQSCVEWQKYQIVKHEKVDFSFGIIQKTGMISLLAIFVTSSNLLIDFIFPVKTRNPDYLLSQDFVSCFTLFVVAPIVAILRNSSMKKFTRQWIFSKFDLIVSSVSRFNSKFVNCKRNKIEPMILPK
jgi:hypothetical protein